MEFHHLFSQQILFLQITFHQFEYEHQPFYLFVYQTKGCSPLPRRCTGNLVLRLTVTESQTGRKGGDAINQSCVKIRSLTFFFVDVKPDSFDFDLKNNS